jgi:hypothetical protein
VGIATMGALALIGVPFFARWRSGEPTSPGVSESLVASGPAGTSGGAGTA